MMPKIANSEKTNHLMRVDVELEKEITRISSFSTPWKTHIRKG